MILAHKMHLWGEAAVCTFIVFFLLLFMAASAEKHRQFSSERKQMRSNQKMQCMCVGKWLCPRLPREKKRSRYCDRHFPTFIQAINIICSCSDQIFPFWFSAFSFFLSIIPLASTCADSLHFSLSLSVFVMEGLQQRKYGQWIWEEWKWEREETTMCSAVDWRGEWTRCMQTRSNWKA